MIITRTPFRISFFGGGTDYPTWYKEHGGQVLSSTFNKYCYISCRYLPPFFEHKFRIAYSKLEYVTDLNDINHPSVRECLRYMDIQDGLEIHHDSDLPARTGLGSSSCFTVGLLHALHALKGLDIDKAGLTQKAIQVEQDWIKEAVGSQDQTNAAYGGFNRITFHPDKPIEVSPISLGHYRKQDLNDHLLLFFTGISRFASEIAQDQISRTKSNTSNLHTMHQLVDTAVQTLNSARPITDFGRLLHETWLLKKSLSQKISNPQIDNLYETARQHGAIGGKLLGAGAGGFFLVFAKPEQHQAIKEALAPLLCIPFAFEDKGSELIFNDKNR